MINHLSARFSRDLRVVHRQVTDSGRAAWLGEDGTRMAGAAHAPAPPEDGLARAVARIHGLFGL